jgi:hypothetical protein
MTTASAFALTLEISALVNGASDTGNVLLLAAVDGDCSPYCRSGVAPLSSARLQLSFSARNAAGRTLATLIEIRMSH